MDETFRVSLSLSHLALLDHLRRHGTTLADRAAAAGLSTAVPTCPNWTVADLVAHQAMVHGWARSKILGPSGTPFRSADEIQQGEPDLVGFYREGHRALVDVLAAAAEDLDAPVFLDNAPAPREFWSRRQTHETTIHSVDALGSALGRAPTALEAGIDAELAIDGLDELVLGFLPGNASELFQGDPSAIAVRPTDTERSWTIRVDAQLSTREGVVDPVAATLVGTAAELYLGLWNRGTELTVEGDAAILERWRVAERISWG